MADDDQAPWWTRPPSAPPARTTEDGDDEPVTVSLTDADLAPDLAPGPRYEPDLPFGAGPPRPDVLRTVPPARSTPAFDPLVNDWGQPEYGSGVTGLDDPLDRPEHPERPEPRDQPVGALPPAAATEQLPSVRAEPRRDDEPDALGVYGTPEGVAPGIPGLSAGDDPLVHLREDRPRAALPVRLLAMAGGALAVLLVVLLVRGLGGGDDKDGGTAAGATASRDTTASAAGPAVSQLSAKDATTLLRKAQQTGTGTVVGAWSWSDKNGKNMLVELKKARSGGDADLRVVHLANVDKDKPKTLRVMQDPDLPNCKGEGTAGFTKNSVQVRDVDADGVAEVTVGWVTRCGGKGARTTAKLVVLSAGEKFILRGEGVLGKQGSGGADPDPKSSSWPKGYLKPLSDQFHKLYF